MDDSGTELEDAIEEDEVFRVLRFLILRKRVFTENELKSESVSCGVSSV